MTEMTGIIYEDEDGRTWMWQLDLPPAVKAQIEAILADYDTTGCSFECSVAELY